MFTAFEHMMPVIKPPKTHILSGTLSIRNEKDHGLVLVFSFWSNKQHQPLKTIPTSSLTVLQVRNPMWLLGSSQGVGRAAFLFGGSRGESISLPFLALWGCSRPAARGLLPPSSKPARGNQVPLRPPCLWFSAAEDVFLLLSTPVNRLDSPK